MKVKKLFWILIVVFWFGNSYAISPQEILENVDEIRAPGEAFTFDIKITLHKNDNKTHELKLFTRVKDAKKSLVIYRYPSASRGRVLLMVEDIMWIYIPGAGRPIMISPQQQIMGDVSNADVARVVYNLDYRAESVEFDSLNSAKVFKLFLTAKTNGAAYQSIILWLEEENYNPIKAEFFALSGRLLKTVYYKDYKLILGKKRPTVLEVHDAIKKSEKTIMEYSNMQMNDTPDIWFQKTFMERVK
jgi:outer membrane lipoprotein-sorting protein